MSNLAELTCGYICECGYVHHILPVEWNDEWDHLRSFIPNETRGNYSIVDNNCPYALISVGLGESTITHVSEHLYVLFVTERTLEAQK